MKIQELSITKQSCFNFWYVLGQNLFLGLKKGAGFGQWVRSYQM
jgi:hypothetical protein